MITWEYKTVDIKDSDLDVVEVLNRHGAEGWEVTCSPQDTGWGMSYLMKRQHVIHRTTLGSRK